MSDSSPQLHGPGGLLSTPGLGVRRRKGRKWGMRLKDSGYGARAGETIRGNLGRSTSGKFERVGTSSPDAPPRFGKAPKKPKKGRAPRKPRATDAQRQEARQVKRQANSAAVAKRMAESDTGLSPSGSAALTAFASGTQPAPEVGGQLAQMGLAEQATDGSYRMTETGRAVAGAMAAGDYQRAIDGISRATDQAGKRTQQQTERTARQQETAAKRTATEATRAARREQVAQRRAEAAAKKPGKGGGSKKPAEAVAKPAAKKPAPKRSARMPSGGGSSSSAPAKAKPPAAAPKPTTADNRGAVRQAMADADQGLAPGGFDNLMALGSGKEPDSTGANGLISMGMAERGSDGTLRLTSGGKQAIAAADRGDAKAAIDAISRASEPKKTKAQSPEDKAMFANMGSSGGGAGGGKATGGTGGLYPKGPSGKRTPQAGAGGGAGKADTKPKGDKPKGEDSYWSKGAMEKRDQERHATGKKKYDDEIKKPLTEDEQRHANTIAYGDRSKGGVGQGAHALDDKTTARARTILAENRDKALADGKYDVAAGHQREINVFNEADKIKRDTQDRSARGSQLHSDVQRAKKIYQKKPNDKNRAALESSWNAYAEHTPGIHSGNEDRAREIMGIPVKAKSFIVYKDHAGTHRWLARTTTSYRDRDNEIISSDALDQDSQRMTATKSFGPLRYWHVGQPDPFDVANPAGPGLDIGDCDYSALIGRTRIEGGTFRDSAIAQKIAVRADQYELSPGFFHPLDQPDTSGVFNAIRTFERSIVPVKYGRASNLFTGLAVKESRMELDEMERRFKAAITDLGLDAAQASALGQQLVQTEKDATAQGIAFKSDGAPEFPDMEINGVVYKAFPPKADATDDPPIEEVKADAPPMVDETVVEDAPPEEDMAGDYIGDMSWDEFAAKLTELLAPVLKMQDMHKGMTDALGEMKTMYGGQVTKDAGTQAEIASLKARLLEIEGDQPATILPDDVAEALKSAGPAQPAEPEKTKIVSTPDRPWAGWGASTFPELYQNGEST